MKFVNKNKLIALLVVTFLVIINIFSKLSYAQEKHPIGGYNRERISGLGPYAQPPADNSDTYAITDYASNLEKIVSMVIGFLTILGGLYFMINFIIGGLSWAGAGGDSGKLEEAKKKMTNGAIGLIIIVAAYSIVYIIGKVLGFSILDITNTIINLGPYNTELNYPYAD